MLATFFNKFLLKSHILRPDHQEGSPLVWLTLCWRGWCDCKQAVSTNLHKRNFPQPYRFVSYLFDPDMSQCVHWPQTHMIGTAVLVTDVLFVSLFIFESTKWSCTGLVPFIPKVLGCPRIRALETQWCMGGLTFQFWGQLVKWCLKKKGGVFEKYEIWPREKYVW